jgi:hypothetical protein
MQCDVEEILMIKIFKGFTKEVACETGING